MKTKYILLLLSVLFAAAGFAQKDKKYVREGNKLYEDGNYSDAEVQYRKALSEDPKSYKGKFNLGDAMYEQKNFDESSKLYNELIESNINADVKSGAYYNMGNSFLGAKKYKEAIDAYKQALRQNPDDQDAKYNLEYARKMLKEQQQQQNQDQNKDQNKDQDKKDEKKDQQDKKDDQNKDQNQKDDQQQDQNKSDQKEDQQKQQQQQPQQISKEDAQRMMEALKNDEKKTLQKLQEQKAKATKAKSSDIDW